MSYGYTGVILWKICVVSTKLTKKYVINFQGRKTCQSDGSYRRQGTGNAVSVCCKIGSLIGNQLGGREWKR